MNILLCADMRTSVKLPNINPDLVILLGDIPRLMVSKIDRQYKCRKLGVLGNHDDHYFFDGTEVENIHNKIISVEGVRIAGFEGSPVYKTKGFGQHSEGTCAEFAKKISNEEIDILVAHSNPVYPKDINADEAHRGFESFNHLLSMNSIRYMFHGHLHDPFVTTLHNTEVHSVYQVKGFIYNNGTPEEEFFNSINQTT